MAKKKPTPKKKSKAFKLGMAFSGGGARGIAHIGVLKALEEQAIYPDVVAGTSAGSIVAALYAAGLDSERIVSVIQSAKMYKAFIPDLTSGGVISLTYLKTHLAKYIEVNDFKGLKRPLYVAVTNLNSGKIELRSKGELFETIQASCSIPLVFTPVTMDGSVFVDGGVMMNLPAEAIRSQCSKLIGVNVMPVESVTDAKIGSMISVAQRIFDLSVYANTRSSSKLCDLVIHPKGLEQYSIFQFNKIAEIMDRGYEAAMEQMDEIKAMME